jgi:hypothetical protein
MTYQADDPDLEWTFGLPDRPDRQSEGTVSLTVRHPAGYAGWTLYGPGHEDKDEAAGRARALARLNYQKLLKEGGW